MKNYQVEIVYKMPNGSQAKVSVHVTASSASEAESQARGRVTGTVISARAKEMRWYEYFIWIFDIYINMLCNKRGCRVPIKNIDTDYSNFSFVLFYKEFIKNILI